MLISNHCFSYYFVQVREKNFTVNLKCCHPTYEYDKTRGKCMFKQGISRNILRGEKNSTYFYIKVRLFICFIISFLFHSLKNMVNWVTMVTYGQEEFHHFINVAIVRKVYQVVWWNMIIITTSVVKEELVNISNTQSSVEYWMNLQVSYVASVLNSQLIIKQKD